MLQKTEGDENDKQTVSTKMPMPTKAASFAVSIKRPIFHNKIDPSTKKQEQSIANAIKFTPDFISYAVRDKVQVLEDGQSFVVQHDSHYTLVTQRSKTYMISRQCPAGGKLLSTSARKPGAGIIFSSLHSYSSPEFPSMYHCNITKYTSAEEKSTESRNIHFSCDPSHTFIAYLTIQNSKKGLLLTQSSTDPLNHRLSLIDIRNQNRFPNPKHISNKKNNSFSFSMKTEEQMKAESEKEQKQFLINEPDKIESEFSLKNGQKVLKIINSEFGDSVLIITNRDIYGVEFEPKAIIVNGINALPKIHKFVSKDVKEDEIKDAVYVIDGLRIITLTKSGYICFIQAESIVSVTLVSSLITKDEDQNILFLHPMVGRLVVETDGKSVVLLKSQGKGKLSFQKRFDLPINFPELQSFNFDVIPKSEQLLLQLVTKRQTLKLEIQKKSILSSGNDFADLYSSLYRLPSEKEVSSIKVSYSLANGIFCMLKDHEITFNRVYEGFSSDNNAIEELFTHSFFEKPLGVSFDPYGSNVIILFREFVKFFKFQYKKLQQFYTYNVRNVNYAAFSPSGEFIIVSYEDMLYFINPFTFETKNAIEAYGDVKNVYFYDTTLYILLRNKVNKNTEALILQIYHEKDGEYSKVEELKIQSDEAIYTDRRFLMIASKKLIRLYQNTKTEEGSAQNWRGDNKDFKMVLQKQIKLKHYSDYPTCVTLCEEFGIFLIGTAQGKIYQYVWPFHDQQEPQHVFVTDCSTSSIASIKFATNFEKLYVICHNKTAFRFQLTQFVEGDEMPNIYVINNKTLYNSDFIKYQFNNRQNFFPNHTTYIFDDLHASSEVIEELRFVQEKLKDDLEEYVIKTTAAYEKQLQGTKTQMRKDVNLIKNSLGQEQSKHKEENEDISETIKVNMDSFEQKIQKYKNEYEKTLLELYKEAARLKKIYADLEKSQTKERDIFLLQNEQVIKEFRKEGEEKQKSFYEKYRNIFEKADNYETFIRIQKEEWINELEDFKRVRHQNVEVELEEEQNRKEGLLGSIGYFSKEITNFKQRKDEFESLIMETKLQIDELIQDRKQYENKKRFLEKELGDKQKLIEQKERQLIVYVKNTTQMKTVKNTHEFELRQYEAQFEPILEKIGVVEENIRKMNEEILKEYSSKVEKQKEITSCNTARQKLLENKKIAIKRKQISQTRYLRFLAQMNFILEDPLNPNIASRLNEATFGDKYEINEEAIQQKEVNKKLMRKKDFIRKEIEEHDKREQQIVRNKNEYFRHYNDNTILVREFNELKQYNKTLQSKMEELEAKIKKIKISNLPAPHTPRKKTNSMLEFKKFSQKKLTPFQRHEQEFHQVFNKGSTTETKLTRSGQSLAFLKTLMKDVEGSDSKYEKMEMVRDRVRSYVNPEIRIRKAMNPQRALFERSKGTLDSLGN